jgi:hypothetical protein
MLRDMAKRNNQSGFGVVEIFAIIATLVIIGVVGWLAYSNFIKRSDTVSFQSDHPSQSPTNSSQTQKTVENIIKIPELGISFVVPDSLKDITYTYSAVNQPTKVGGSNIIIGSASFSTKSFTAKYPGCSSDGTAPPLGSITKVTGVYSDGVVGPTWSGGGMLRQFTDSFLTVAHAQAACYFDIAGNDQSVVDSINSEVGTLNDALKNAKEI